MISHSGTAHAEVLIKKRRRSVAGKMVRLLYFCSTCLWCNICSMNGEGNFEMGSHEGEGFELDAVEQKSVER